jgi:hypothetical protein
MSTYQILHSLVLCRVQYIAIMMHQGRRASSECISDSVTKQCPAIRILLLWLKPQYSQVTHQSLQQKEVNLPLFSHCTNQFDGVRSGFSPPAISRRNINTFISTHVSHCSFWNTNSLTYTTWYTHVHLASHFYNSVLDWHKQQFEITYLELKIKMNKFKKDPKLSCVKISGVFQNLVNV